MNPGEKSIYFDTPGFDMMNRGQQKTARKQFAYCVGCLLAWKDDYVVTLKEHYYVDLGDSANMKGNALFAWAKDLTANEDDIIFAINPKPLIAAGVDPEKVDGWNYVPMLISQEGKEVQTYQFVKTLDLMEVSQ